MECILNEDELIEKCTEWQEILGLQNWVIGIAAAKSNQFELSGSEGEVDWVLSRKEAKIKILDPVDYPENTFVPFDMETCLVHELLHLHYAPFDNTEPKTLENIALEQSIHFISKALVDLKRKEVINMAKIPNKSGALIKGAPDRDTPSPKIKKGGDLRVKK